MQIESSCCSFSIIVAIPIVDNSKFSDDQVLHGSYALDVTYHKHILEKWYIVNDVEMWLKRVNMIAFS